MDIITIQGINCYEKNGVAYLNLEAVARGLGFTQTQIKSGTEYTSVRWETIRKYLGELGFEVFPNLLGKDGLPNYIPENIFYRLAMKAKNETAEKFQALIADEVIPAIRKHGGYLTPEKAEEILTDPDTIIRLATDLKKERAARIAAEAKIEEQAPKVTFAEAIEKSDDNIHIADMARILNQKGFKIGQNKLFALLRAQKILMDGRYNGEWNMPYQRYLNDGYFVVQESCYHDSCYGRGGLSITPLITPKGQIWIANHIREWMEK